MGKPVNLRKTRNVVLYHLFLVHFGDGLWCWFYHISMDGNPIEVWQGMSQLRGIDSTPCGGCPEFWVTSGVIQNAKLMPQHAASTCCAATFAANWSVSISLGEPSAQKKRNLSPTQHHVDSMVEMSGLISRCSRETASELVAQWLNVPKKTKNRIIWKQGLG